jgi:hypothetical protein
MQEKSKYRTLTQLFKPGDIFLMVGLICIALGLGIIIKQKGGNANYCIISVDGKDKYKLSLFSPQKIKIKGVFGESVIEVSKKGVRMVNSPCPLHICVQQGIIKRVGQTIVCIPNRIMIRILGKQKIDATTW